MERLTPAQLELWVFLAVQNQERLANLNAFPINEHITDICVAAGLVKRR